MNQNKLLFAISFILFSTLKCLAQTPIEVCDLTQKLKAFSTEELYFGFEAGDQIIFNFEEVHKKEVKEVEISEYPATSRFMDYETKKIDTKTIKVTKRGIYKFRFYNSSLWRKVCKIKIQRIPENEKARIFNTEVVWKTVYDTTYETLQQKYLVKRDTIPELVTNANVVVHSSTTLRGNPNRSTLEFELPDNTICWTYWIGVNGDKGYEKAKHKMISSAAKSAGKIPEYGPLLALALYGVNYFSYETVGDNVSYYFINDVQNLNLFSQGAEFYQYKEGANVITDFGKMTSPRCGKSYLGLLNHNIRDGISVNVKILAIRVVEKYATRTIRKPNIIASVKPCMVK